MGKAKVRGGGTFASAIEEKKKVVLTSNKLGSLLFKHKEQLKKEIAKKRSQLEKELSIEIAKEVDSLKKQAALKLGAENASLIARKLGAENAAEISRKRKSDALAVSNNINSALESAQATKKRRKSDKR